MPVAAKAREASDYSEKAEGLTRELVIALGALLPAQQGKVSDDNRRAAANALGWTASRLSQVLKPDRQALKVAELLAILLYKRESPTRFLEDALDLSAFGAHPVVADEPAKLEIAEAEEPTPADEFDSALQTFKAAAVKAGYDEDILSEILNLLARLRKVPGT